MTQAKTAIIIPGYNEEKYIKGVLERVKKVADGALIIMVNDGSSDETKRIAQSIPCVVVVSHKVNLGKGSAAKTGCDYAYRKGAQRFVLLDADGQHEPEDIPKFLEELQKNDIVFGYRVGGKSPVYKNVGNWGLNVLTKILFNMDIKDTQCGFRAFNRKAYRRVRWKSTSYGMETEMIKRAKRLTYTQLPIKKIYLDDYKGTSVIDGFKIVREMLRWKLFG